MKRGLLFSRAEDILSRIVEIVEFRFSIAEKISCASWMIGIPELIDRGEFFGGDYLWREKEFWDIASETHGSGNERGDFIYSFPNLAMCRIFMHDINRCTGNRN